MKKVAFVHDRIVTIWWAEKVFMDLINNESFDDAEIFCLFSDKEHLQIWEKKIKINKVIWNDFIINKIGYRNLMPIFPILNKFMNKQINNYNPDKVVISSFAIAKNIKTEKYKKLYLHSPMQYIRWSYDEYINKFSWIKKYIYKLTSKYLRSRDKKFNKYDEIYFNSYYTKKLSNEIYWINWKVKYPKIKEIYRWIKLEESYENYYIFIWRLVKFSKELDKIIELFNRNNEFLLVVWTWADEDELKNKVNWNIIFLWEINDEFEKIKLITKSKWLINITKESFWIVTAESLALGVPVFWYKDWASCELVDENSWILVENKDISSLEKDFYRFSKTNFNRVEIKNNFWKKYDEIIFHQE